MLTNEQGQFLDAEGKIVLCACPGSGKTFVVGKKVVKYLVEFNTLGELQCLSLFINVF